MASVIDVHNGRDGYRTVLEHVVQFGVMDTARGFKTRDNGHTTIVLREPYDALPLGVGRKLDPKIAAVEAIQLIGGFYDHSLVEKRAPQLLRYTDPVLMGWDDEGNAIEHQRLHGAYGRRINTQVDHAVSKLNEDSGSRQAVVTLWEPHSDNVRGKRDYPCTVALGFRVRPGDYTESSNKRYLDMNVVMRSNDVWLGLPYDMFQFTQLMITVARVLRCSPGTYHHTAWSLHAYNSDMKKITEFLDTVHVTSDGYRPYQPNGIGHDVTDVPLHFDEVRRRAQQIAVGNFPENMTTSEGWYGEQLT